MLSAMKPFRNSLLYALGGVLLGVAAPWAQAETQSNPYQAIVERNPFGLKEPPPPPSVEKPPPPVPLSSVKMTGTTSMFGTPRVLLEITEQEAGKAPTLRKPILREGEKDGAIEVVSINIERSLVKIRNAGIETNLTFEAPKLTASAPPVGNPGIPALGAMNTPAPNVFTPANAAANSAGRGSGFTVFGGSSSGGAAPYSGGANPGMGARGGTPGLYGGAGPTLNDGSGLRPIPTRSLRTDTPPIDAAAQYLMMHASSEVSSAAGIPHPPVPPAPDASAYQKAPAPPGLPPVPQR
jgi:hypothetical protein